MASESFKRVFLETHNSLRSQHGAPSLSYNSDMCTAAQAWADTLLKKNQLEHSSTSDGENVYYSCGSGEPRGNEAVDSWYSEIKDYNFQKPGFGMNTGHFTQVVWKDSTELGVGVATDGTTVFVVGQYRKAGNINNPGYFEKNVLPKE
ncbi:unnamed protein product [Knipowitschia caucasica]